MHRPAQGKTAREYRNARHFTPIVEIALPGGQFRNYSNLKQQA
jgi:hypothetical protein